MGDSRISLRAVQYRFLSPKGLALGIAIERHLFLAQDWNGVFFVVKSYL